MDLWNIPIARITEQYLQYLEIMSELNINVAGEFIVMAATLIEIKSRMMTPEPEPMPEEEPDDPRMELVRQLMEYKRFKEAALALNDRAELRAERFARPGERPDGGGEARIGGAGGREPLDAPGGVLEESSSRPAAATGSSSTPCPRSGSSASWKRRCARRAGMTFAGVFQGQASRMRLIGMFIALLELVRQQAIRVEQGRPFGEIWLTYVPPEERVEGRRRRSRLRRRREDARRPVARRDEPEEPPTTNGRGRFRDRPAGSPGG